MLQLDTAGRLTPTGKTLGYIRFIDDFPVYPVVNYWPDTGTGSFTDEKVYVVQTGTKTIERCLLMTSDPGDLVLDPTCGSGTTAYVAEQWGRRWITIDTSRVALALARTRLMAAKFPYYLLADSIEGVRKEAEVTGKVPPDSKTTGDIRRGFVYKRVPHVTLKSIANSPDITGGMSREAIDAAIARHAETETLYDKPYEDTKRIRVTGPFTVESLSPHRVLSEVPDDGRPSSEREGERDVSARDFVQMILDNLKKAGVQNTTKKERLVFDRLEPFAGQWLQAEGRYTDADGKSHHVAVSIGPEHGTVGPTQVQEAAKEAVRGVGFDVLVVCGFAFDPYVNEDVKQYGRLTVLPTRMNPDLAMGEELLKKTGAANLFMIFGEPDVAIDRDIDGNLVVSVRGVDVHDPTTGQVRSPFDRRRRLLVHRHQLQRRELLRAPRVFLRGRRAVREAEARPARRDRRSHLVHALQHHQPPVRPTRAPPDRREGDQPLRRRSAEGLPGLAANEPWDVGSVHLRVTHGT
ncbi:MAG: DNA methyltransferase [Vicinamibacterales bacterium]